MTLSVLETSLQMQRHHDTLASDISVWVNQQFSVDSWLESVVNYCLTYIQNWLRPLIAPTKVTFVTVTWRLIVRPMLFVSGHHCTVAFRDFLLMASCSHLPWAFDKRPSNWLAKPVRQSKDNRVWMHWVQCGLPAKELIACLYTGVDTHLFLEYEPSLTSWKRHLEWS